MLLLFCTILFIALSGTANGAPPFSRNAAPVSHVLKAELSGATDMFVPKPEVVSALFRNGLLEFTGATNDAAAWATILSPEDTIGIKVFSTPGSNSGTRPDVVAALVESLLNAGYAPEKVIIWDRDFASLRRAGFAEIGEKFKVRVAAASDFGWDANVFYESSILGTPVWGDLEFGRKGDEVGRKSHVSKLLTSEITRLISVAPLLNHNLSGVTGHLYSLSLSSVDNAVRFESRRERLETAVPEITGLPEIYDRLVLSITDALICQYAGEQRTLLHYSVPLNQLWFSKDPVALDVISLAELERHRTAAGKSGVPYKTDLYSNAALLELGTSDTNRVAVRLVK